VAQVLPCRVYPLLAAYLAKKLPPDKVIRSLGKQVHLSGQAGGRSLRAVIGCASSWQRTPGKQAAEAGASLVASPTRIGDP
jgi:hypothetical protein